MGKIMGPESTHRPDGGDQTGVEGEDRTLVISQLPVKGTAEFCLLTSTCCGLRL